MRDHPEIADALKQGFKTGQESAQRTINIALEYTPDSLVFHGKLMAQTLQNLGSKAQDLIQLNGYEEYLGKLTFRKELLVNKFSDRISDLMLELQKRLNLA